MASEPKINPVKISMRLLDGTGREGPQQQKHSPVTVYLPFQGAEFGAQRRINYPGIWGIVHVATSRLMPGWVVPDYLSRKEALVDAYRLSVGVPHAAAVRYVDGKLTGDMTRMRDEVLEALSEAPATT